MATAQEIIDEVGKGEIKVKRKERNLVKRGIPIQTIRGLSGKEIKRIMRKFK